MLHDLLSLRMSCYFFVNFHAAGKEKARQMTGAISDSFIRFPSFMIVLISFAPLAFPLQ